MKEKEGKGEKGVEVEGGIKAKGERRMAGGERGQKKGRGIRIGE